MDAMAEALAQAEGEQDMEKKIEQALACPCLGEPVGRGLHVLVRPTVQGLNACDSQAQACRRLECPVAPCASQDGLVEVPCPLPASCSLLALSNQSAAQIASRVPLPALQAT